MRTLLIALIVILTPASFEANGQPCDTLEPLQWILGEWEAQGENLVTWESWDQVSPQTFEGSGRVTMKANGELRSEESIQLVEMSGEVFYLAKAAHNELPIAFKLTRCSGERAVFENQKHDFPRQLVYKRSGNDSLHVHVSDGGEKGFVLRFSKKNTH